MTRTKKASVFREDLFGEAGENMLKAMCWPEQALICLRYGVETSEGSLMGQNNTEEKHLQIESVWKRCPLHLVGGFPGQGTANRLRLPTGLMTPETHIFSDLISFPALNLAVCFSSFLIKVFCGIFFFPENSAFLLH